MSDSEIEDYITFKLCKKDIETARKEINEFEKILNKAKKSYKEKYNQEYDYKWYNYITHILNWFNPLSYINISQYSTKSDAEIFKEGYNMYSSYYDDMFDDDY